MPFFSDAKLHDAHLPGSLLSLLRSLDRFEQLCDELHLHPPASDNDDRPRILRERYQSLVEASRELLPPGIGLVAKRDAVEAFAIGALLLLHYEETVLGPVGLLDTVGSRTLDKFKLDVASCPASREALHKALAQALDLSRADLDAIRAGIQPELEALRFRQALVEALERLHPLGTNPRAPGLSTRIHDLFDLLYPGNPLRPGEVEVIATGTSLFFMVPFTGVQPDRPGGALREPAEREALAAFLNAIDSPKQHQLDHFPVFGFFRGERVDPALLEALAGELDSTTEAVARVLTSMVTILRSAEVDKFIVHDFWGHQWQAHLSKFDRDYQRVARFERLPDLDEELPTQDGGRVSLLKACDGALAKIAQGEELGVEYWDPYLDALVADRVTCSMSVLVAEMLADVVEYKFLALNPEAAEDMPSSSFFKESPAKFDLTLKDLQLYFRMALKGLRRFAEREADQERLVALLLERRPSVEGPIRAAVASLRGRVDVLLDTQFAPRFQFEASAEGVEVTLYARFALNLLGLHTTLLDRYWHLAETPLDYKPPLRDFRDLLVFATGAFFQENPRVNFWHMDEFLGHFFQPALEALLEALAEGV